METHVIPNRYTLSLTLSKSVRSLSHPLQLGTLILSGRSVAATMVVLVADAAAASTLLSFLREPRATSVRPFSHETPVCHLSMTTGKGWLGKVGRVKDRPTSTRNLASFRSVAALFAFFNTVSSQISLNCARRSPRGQQRLQFAPNLSWPLSKRDTKSQAELQGSGMSRIENGPKQTVQKKKREREGDNLSFSPWPTYSRTD